MNDKEIRKILVSYLEATHNKIRIYHEKNIGAAICDVMVVTDKLTGFEIKSDLDNYKRLDNQVRTYDRFFDENYLVVSVKNLQSSRYRVPNHWGILCVTPTGIHLERSAGKNKYVSRACQLGILWKLELKNLLVKNHLPMFAQKSKDYIRDRIMESVDKDTLGPQIAQELVERDYSIYDAVDYTEYETGSNAFPAGEIVDMLSERDLSEFTLDKWIALYRQATTAREKKSQATLLTKEPQITHSIPYTDIAVSLGAPWIKKFIIIDFIEHILGSKPRFSIDVAYEEITGHWSIQNKKYLAEGNINAEVKYGLQRYNALQIIEATLNLREIKIYDDGSVYNEQDTLEALEKQRLINEEFNRWIWLDADRRWEVEDAYNRLFAGYAQCNYDGSHLAFPDMSAEYQLFPYQKDAIQKIITEPNTLLAFDVGAGKTYIMIAAAMQMRSSGISRKNMFVVPNHIVGQWEKMFTDLYPNAKVLAIEPKSFKPEIRTKILTQIRDGDYDGIIIAYSCFEMIPLSSAVILNNMNTQLVRLQDALEDYKKSGYYWDVQTPINQEMAHIRKLNTDFLKSMETSSIYGITFDQLEITTLFVDEAHNYKNIPIRTKLKNLNGINTKGSVKCQDLLQKVRCVQHQNHGRGVVFSTGTPLCNSIADAYAMQIYLQYEELKKAHLDVFDNWVKTFALPEQLCEIDVDTSKYRMIRRFSKFFNLPELSKMFSQIAIFHAVTDHEDLPNMEGYTDIVIGNYPELAAYMKSLSERTEMIRQKFVDPKRDNMLKVSTDGRKAALHLSLVGEEQPGGEYSKVDRCVENVVAQYHQYSLATQVIFCDYSTPKAEAFNVYDDLREQLIRSGIPQKEIAFIHNFNTESKRLSLFSKFNSGKIRVLIGSTFKLGTGANVQAKLRAIHHLDVPWRPADMVQREGRILRRGNENKEIQIFRYITEGSFDSYSWQLLERKLKFITQFLSGSGYQRSVEDLESNVLSYGEVKALALAEPQMRLLAEKENELRSLQILAEREKNTKANLRQELHSLPDIIAKEKDRQEITLRAASALRQQTAEIYSLTFQQIKEYLTEDVFLLDTEVKLELPIPGFTLTIPQEQDPKRMVVLLCYNGEEYAIEMGDSAAGNARRVINFLKAFDKVLERQKEKLSACMRRKDEITALLSVKESSYAEKCAVCEREIASIRRNIEIIVP